MEDRSDRRVLPKGRIRIPDRTPGLRIVLYVGVGNERYTLCERRLQISGLVFDITDAQDWRARHHSVPARGKARVLHLTKYDDKVINCASDAAAKSEPRTATKPPLSVQRSKTSFCKVESSILLRATPSIIRLKAPFSTVVLCCSTFASPTLPQRSPT